MRLAHFIHPLHGGFSHVTFQSYRGGVALLLFASLFSVSAFADGRGVLRCDSCTTVNDFSVTAENYVETHITPPESDLNHYRFVIFNPTDKLLGQVVVVRFYDYETRTLNTRVWALTGTVADMQQEYRVGFPDLGITWIPASVASTYTGSSQQNVVGPYLADYYADSNPVQGDTTLAVFPDYSSAVYQLTDAAASDWTMVSMSGHDSDGNPLNDSAQSVTTTPPPGTVITPSGPTIDMKTTGGGYGVEIFGIAEWDDGVIYCMVNGCTHVAGS